MFDGCEYSPDGEWIYCNTELFSDAEGHAQIARLRPDGTQLQQLTFDERVNWFPHISPDGAQIVFVSFPAGIIGHPPNLPVELKLVRDGNWQALETLVQTFGRAGHLQREQLGPRQHPFRLRLLPDSPATVSSLPARNRAARLTKPTFT